MASMQYEFEVEPFELNHFHTHITSDISKNLNLRRQHHSGNFFFKMCQNFFIVKVMVRSAHLIEHDKPNALIQSITYYMGMKKKTSINEVQDFAEMSKI